MDSYYDKFESRFEKVSEFSTRVLGNSIVFTIVFIIDCSWIFLVIISGESLTEIIRDSFIAVSFLTFFLVQRALNKYNRVINVKLNELVRAHDNANNDLINVEQKTHKEIDELAKELHEGTAPDSSSC